MAIRTPLKLDSTNLKEMTTANITAIVDRMVYLYFTDPSVTLSVVGSSGSLDAINDTRMKSGAATTDVTNYDTAAETPDIQTVTVTYDRIDEAVASPDNPTDTGLIKYPIYTDGGNIHAMDKTDMYETFSAPAIDAIIAAQPYKIHTSTSAPGGYTRVSSTPVFVDTKANVGAYSASNIGTSGTTQDLNTTVNSYYLHRANGTAAASLGAMYIDSNQNIREYTQAQLDVILLELVRYTTASLTGAKLRYFIGGSGTTLGTGMANTKLSDGGVRHERFVNTNDYRTQEFPSGTNVSTSTYYLKARKV